MTVINTNMGSLYAQSAMSSNARGLSTVMQQLSTGKRINSAVDDVAGLAISTRLTSQIRGLNQAVRNTNDGISLIQTAEGATEQITNMLQRMRELTVQSANDTNNSNDRLFLDGEFQQLKAEINRIGQNTQWNGANILDGTGGNQLNGTYEFQVGANSAQTIGIKLPNIQTSPADPNQVTFSAAAGAAPGTAAVDFTALDTTGTPSSYLGVTVQATFGGKAVQHMISQDDIDHVTATGAWDPSTHAGATAQALSSTVVQSLAKSLNVPLWSDSYTASEPTSGTLLVTPKGSGVALDPTNDMSASAKTVKGDLEVINASAIKDGALVGATLSQIDSALQIVNADRSNMGAVISRLQFASDNLTNISTKATESRSRIEDTDYSQATTELAKRNIIQQAAQAMLAQANQQPQMVLQLLK